MLFKMCFYLVIYLLEHVNDLFKRLYTVLIYFSKHVEKKLLGCGGEAKVIGGFTSSLRVFIKSIEYPKQEHRAKLRKVYHTH